ncbi:mechanosensitive ion channel family protein [Chitinivorax sp. B]|uniref:mechanosensitive ion channel family protein n=1 Tax=Chitinivorax sp. B TaxID=2502235 RepID=UPI0010F73272|nr:mechanosensitive ion channel family protein [Chitinivorax sp. B]
MPFIHDKAILVDLISSGMLAVLLLALRVLVRRAIVSRDDLSIEIRRRWLVSLRNTGLLIFLFGLIFIWGSEIRTFAVSVVAVTAAIVVATRELIMCLVGAIYRTSSHAFDVGDMVELNGVKGKVVDLNLLSTTLLVSKQASGQSSVARLATIPNSLLFGQPAFNDALLGDYTLHLISIPLPVSTDWQRAERLLLEAATDECQPYLDQVNHHVQMLERNRSFDMPGVGPWVRIRWPDHEKIELELQVPLPLQGRSHAEQRILKAFLKAWQQATQPDEVTSRNKEAQQSDVNQIPS